MVDSIREVTITGRVQGVGYRAWLEHKAKAHGVEGWVRNRRDGTVEALFAGSVEVVSEMIASCDAIVWECRSATMAAESFRTSDELGSGTKRAKTRYQINRITLPHANIRT